MRKITVRLLTKLPTKYISNGLILILMLFAYGIIGSYFIMKLNFTDSVYYSVITMTTVGYGDYIPLTRIQKIFATTLSLGGVALLAYVFNILLTNFQERMSEYSKGVKQMKAIDKLDDYYIICGFGRVGKVVYEQLMQRKRDIIIIDKNKEICENIEKTENVVVINEEAIENDLIAKLSGEKCKSVIICTGDDVTNLFIVLTIRELNPDAWIVSRASAFENMKRLKNAGANKIVSPEITGGHDLFLESSRPHLLRITIQHTPEFTVDEFKIIEKHGCNLENIEYHILGVETPLTREINHTKENQGLEFKNFIDNNPQEKEYLLKIYEISNNIHSHLISGPNEETFNKLVNELKKRENVIGINLSNKEISKLTKEMVEKDND